MEDMNDLRLAVLIDTDNVPCAISRALWKR